MIRAHQFVPIGARLIDVRIDHVEGHRLVGVHFDGAVHEGVVIRGDRVPVECHVAIARVEDALANTATIRYVHGSTL